MYYYTLGSVIEFVNETLVDVLLGDKALIIAPMGINANETVEPSINDAQKGLLSLIR